MQILCIIFKDRAAIYALKEKGEMLMIKMHAIPTDLLTAALETKQFNVLICTGNLYPPVTILVKARELNVPIILVPYDKNTTARLLANAQGYIFLENKEKIKLAQELIEKHVDWIGLIDSI